MAVGIPVEAAGRAVVAHTAAVSIEVVGPAEAAQTGVVGSRPAWAEWVAGVAHTAAADNPVAVAEAAHIAAALALWAAVAVVAAHIAAVGRIADIPAR